MSETKTEPRNWKKDAALIESVLTDRLQPLKIVLDSITKKWKEKNIENIFSALPSVVFYNGTFRCKIVLESAIGTNNVIFFFKQRMISELLVDHKADLRDEMDAFVADVLNDLVVSGINGMRIETIKYQRQRFAEERKYQKKDVPTIKAQIFIYPLTPDETYENHETQK